MKRTSCKAILSTVGLAVCVTAQAQNVYSLSIYAGGTSYNSLYSFTSAVPPLHYELTQLSWFQDAKGYYIIDVGHELERGGILHQSLEVKCGTESFSVPLGKLPRNAGWGADLTDCVILAVVMQTGYPKSVATLAAVLDGSAGFYSTNGGGMLRAGQDAQLKAAARKLVADADGFRAACALTREFPLPEEAHTRFYFIMPSGVLTSQVEQAVLAAGSHRMSPLFRAAQELIARIQARLAQENKKAELGAPPNGSPAERLGNSGVSGGPPSVS